MAAPVPDPSPPRIRHEALLALVLLAAVVGALVFLAVRGFEVMSAARAFVNGEGLWSKSQKEAVRHLSRYARAGDPADYETYLAHMQVPLAARKAASELGRPSPDYARVAEGLRESGNHPDDLDRMIWFIERFSRVPSVREAIGIWVRSDSLISRIQVLGAAIHEQRLAGAPPMQLAELEDQLHMVDGQLAALEPEFSEAIGRAARWGQDRLTLFTILTGLVLLTVTGLLTWIAAKRIESQQEALTRREHEFRRVFEGARHGIMRSTVDGRILAANSALAELLGYDSLDELMGRNVNRDLYVTPGERERILEDAARTGVPDVAEVRWRRRDGRIITVRITGQLIRDAEGRLVETEVFVEDVSERLALEGKLRQAQKMEAIGLLAGGIAHDFNNLLTVMLSTTTLLEEAVDPAHPTAPGDLASLRRSAQRGAAMVRKLMAFGRAGTLDPMPLDLPATVTEAAEVLRRVLPSSIRLDLDLDPATPAVSADNGAIEQVLLNLATNARDAMPDGGVLSIRTGAAELAEGRVVQGRMVGPGLFGCLTVRDSGTGMDEATLERLFDPFFTTKGPGEGTGLGAAMVYGLVAQQGGLVEASSIPGDGTEVRILLPAASEAPESTGATARLVGGQERLLLVEDDTTVQQTTARVLRRAGYHVTVTGDGHEALDQLAQESFDLVVSDVVMARMGGLALHREARARGHAEPFLFLSGYTGGEAAGGSDLPADAVLLRKPWSIDELLTTIRRRLAG